MPAGESLIDLDGHDLAGPRNTGRRRSSTVLRLVAAFAAGLVLGGIGVKVLQDSREQRKRDASFALVALASPSGEAEVSSEGFVTVRGRLSLINAGPASITVLSAQAQMPGIVVRGGPSQLFLAAGGSGPLDVELVHQCSITFGYEPLSMRFSVKSADRQVSEVRYPVSLVDSPWPDLALRMCKHP